MITIDPTIDQVVGRIFYYFNCDVLKSEFKMSLNKIFGRSNQLFGCKIMSTRKQHSNKHNLQDLKSVNIHYTDSSSLTFLNILFYS